MSYEVKERKLIFCFKMIRIWKIKDVVALADFILARKDFINVNVNKPEKKRKEANCTC